MINGGYHSRAGSPALSGPIPFIDVPIANWAQVRSVLHYGLYLVALNNERFDGPTYKQRTMRAANDLYPGTFMFTTVERAWTAVGIGSGCTSRPAVPVITDFGSFYCRGRYDITWQQLPGLKYHSETVLGSFANFDAATTTTDGAISSCSLDLPRHGHFRMRACNGCGCSDWTPTQYLPYYSPCL